MKSKFIVAIMLSCLFLMNLTSLSMIQRPTLPTFEELQIQLFECRKQVNQLTAENQLLRTENARLRTQLQISPAVAPTIVRPEPIPTLPNPNFELFAGPAPRIYHYIYKLKIDDKPETEWALVPRYENKEQPVSLQFTKQLVLTAALTENITVLTPITTAYPAKRTFFTNPNNVYFCILIQPATRVSIGSVQIIPQDASNKISGRWEDVPNTPQAKKFAKEIFDRFKRIQNEKNLPENWSP